MARAEEVDEPARGDRVGAEPAARSTRLALALRAGSSRSLAAARYRVGSVLTSSSNEEVAATVVGHKVSMLGTGLIGLFYTRTLHGQRNRDRVHVVYSRSEERAEAVLRATTTSRSGRPTSKQAIAHPETDTVVIGLPNQLHEEAVELCAKHGKAVLCTKPLARTAAEAKRMLDTVESAGVFGGYLEDLVYTPKTLKAVAAVQAGQIGDVLWARSRETHPGPHSAWFWDAAQAGGGPIVDLGCHCIEIIRSYMGKENRPVEVMCWTDTLVHPIEAEDNAIALIRFESGAMGQFEVSWTFRGGMDLRDEVAGTEGTIWTNHFLRTGFEIFTVRRGRRLRRREGRERERLALPRRRRGRASSATSTCSPTCSTRSTRAAQPRETFYDGYVVNAIIDACYRSAETRQWEPVQLDDWRGAGVPRIERSAREHDGKTVIKEEKMPDGRSKLILKDEATASSSTSSRQPDLTVSETSLARVRDESDTAGRGVRPSVGGVCSARARSLA